MHQPDGLAEEERQEEHTADRRAGGDEDQPGQDVHSPDQEMAMPSSTSSSSQPVSRPTVGQRTADHERKWGTQAVHPGKRPVEVEEGQQSSPVRKAGRTDAEGEQPMNLGAINGIPGGLLKAAIKVLSGVDITEIFSPERVAAEAKRFGLTAGLSMDLTTGWDFRVKADRQRAKHYVRTKKPLLVIGLPVCKPFSRLQALNWGAIQKDRSEADQGFGRGHAAHGVRRRDLQDARRGR